MFDNDPIYVVVRETNGDSVLRLAIEPITSENINRIFDEKFEFLQRKESVVFDGDYMPSEDEILSISDFQLPDYITESIREPLTTDVFHPTQDNLDCIRAICVVHSERIGDRETYTIAFQKFKKEQYLSTKMIDLFFTADTFVCDNRLRISVRDELDCYYDNGNLKFRSYYIAKQIFDLQQYYRTATNGDIEAFTNLPTLDFEECGGAGNFMENTNNWIRRKIASINDTHVLENFSAEEIKRIAHVHSGIEVRVSNGRIAMPNTTKDIKILLSCLDNETWKGAFSQDYTYMSNSKRKVER